MFNNDRLSHWCLGVVLSWPIHFVLWILPIFHLWLKIPIKTVAAYTALAAGVQLAVTPWLFAARATRENPAGRRVQRTAVVIVWISLTAFLFACFMLHGEPPDPGARAIFLGGPIVTGAGALIALALVWRKQKARQGSNPGRDRVSS